MKPKIDRMESPLVPYVVTKKPQPEDIRTDADRVVLHSTFEHAQPFEDHSGLYGNDPQLALGGLPVGHTVRVVAKSRPTLIGSGGNQNSVKEVRRGKK
jgi:hypothetical protein